MIVEANVGHDGYLYLGKMGEGNEFLTSSMITEQDLARYESKGSDKSKLKSMLKLKEAGFTADEILELIKEI